MNSKKLKLNLNKANRVTEQFTKKISSGLLKSKFDINTPLMISASGGSDSTALLLGLKLLNKDFNNLTVIHVNHKLRDIESEEDALFLKKLCDSLEIPLLIKNEPVPCIKTDSLSNLEERLSHIRYDIFAKSATDSGIDTIATGHTMDDNSESVLLNITRGTSLRGISGIRRIKKLKQHGKIPPIKIIRPMLQIDKKEIKQFLKEMKLNYRTDSTNIDISYSRNRIRHVVIPELEQLNPKLKYSIYKLSQNANSQLSKQLPLINKLWNSDFIIRTKEKIVLDKRIFNILPSETIHMLFIKAGKFISSEDSIYSEHIKMISKFLKTSKYTKLEFSEGLIIENYRYKLVFKNNHLEEINPFPKILNSKALKIPGKVQLTENHSIQAKMHNSPINLSKGFQMETFLDLSKVKEPLFIRTKKPGDKIRLLGMSGHKSLNHLMIDRKIPLIWRKNIPVIEKDEKIVWVVGFPPADWAKITENTRKIVNLKYLINNINESPVF